ncbi:TPA: hypothetical protein I6209_002938 [Vibrio cholerae]|uniref:hypothetical protein n=3 Tax=Vibrio cholerae TaxID=666 RepID=UPI0010599069|nr:hypothetical protein [Vibrio cholerae]EJL6466895.1 hypothetical protein [Vibrio cholerae]EKG0020148.1 hypothetical protein [Vibrio cholerae]MBP0925254.1 hypothetical protein [Vibrio cholerae]MCX9521990.1 hypothetical protein [Vibrio cholerae]MCX9524658.1 hypothetical protein [Vibrio cholerae]
MHSNTQRLPAQRDENPSYLAYHKAVTPADFTDLLGIGREAYCRYVWSPHINPHKSANKPAAWQAIGQRQSGKPVSKLIDIKLQAEGYVAKTGVRTCSLDLFVSPNQFFDWRNTKQLAQLHANWIDIDTVGHDVISQEQQESLFTEVLQILREQSLPAPTGYVASGSGGMHLYWIYEGVPAYKWRIRVWREISLVLARTLKQARRSDARWIVDFAASRDPARVLRLPGTFHGKSGRIVQAFVGGPVYDFNKLAVLLVRSEQNQQAIALHQQGRLEDLKPKTKAKPAKPSQSKPAKHPGRHTIGQWWFRIYSVICSHARSKGVAEGKRDLHAFILYIALRHIKRSPEDAYQAIKALNAEFIHLTEDELAAYLKSAQQKHYKYTKDSIAEYLESNLGIASDFLFESTKATLTPEEIRSRQHDAAKNTADSRRTNTLTALQKALTQLVKTRMTVTQKAIALLTGRSVRTVRRYWRELKTFERSFGPALYIPAPGYLSA